VPDGQSIQGRSHRIVRNSGEPNLELPAADTVRWSSRRKAAVVVATRLGVISRAEACQRYMLSDEELARWEVAYDRRGIPSLRSVALHLDRAGVEPAERPAQARKPA
jgi:hypothetical protein